MPPQNSSSKLPKEGNVVKKPTLYLVYFVAFLDLFAVSMLTPLLRKQSLDLGSSYTTAGLLGSVYGATQLFSSPFIGDWSDRLGRTHVMFLTTLLAAAGYFITAMSQWLPLIFLGRAICGFFKHTQTLTKAYLADLGHTGSRKHSKEKMETTSTSEKEVPLAQSFGFFMAISSSGFIIGPIVGGHLAEFENGIQIVSLSVAVIFLVNAAIIGSLPPRTAAGGRRFLESSHRADVAKTVTANLDIFFLQFLVSMSVMVVRTNYIQHVEENFNISIKWAGYLTSYQAIVSVIGSACVSSRIMEQYKYTPRLVLHTTVLLGISVMGIAYTSNFGVYLASLSILNFMTPFSRMANLRQLLERSENPQHHGALMGISQSVASFSRLSSSFLSGIAQDYFENGPEMISVACTAAAIGQTLLAYQ